MLHRLCLKKKRHAQFKLSRLHTSHSVVRSWRLTLPHDSRRTSQCVRFRHTRVPTQFDALQASAPAKSSGTCVPSPSRFVMVSSWGRSRYRQDAISQCSQCSSGHVACLSFFFFFSSWSMHRAKCQDSSAVAKGFTQFCTCLNQDHHFRQLPLFCLFTHRSAGSFGAQHVSHHVVVECGVHGQ